MVMYLSLQLFIWLAGRMMAQQLRIHTVLEQDQSLVSSTYVKWLTVCNVSCREIWSIRLPWVPALTRTCAQAHAAAVVLLCKTEPVSILAWSSREMTEQLRVCIALAEDLSLIPSPHFMQLNHDTAVLHWVPAFMCTIPCTGSYT